MWIHLSLSLILATVPTRVYHCLVDGVPTFSDRSCEGAVTLTIDPAIAVPFARLGPDEERALEALEARLARDSAARAKQRSRERQRRERDRKTLDAACNKATRDLEGLIAQRRKGYRLSDATKLAAAESMLQESIRLNCR